MNSDPPPPLFADGALAIRRCRRGLMLFNRNDSYIGRSLDLYGEYSPGEGRIFESFVRRGDVVVDGGANIGAHTLHFAALAGNAGRVIAFESQATLHHMLCANLALNRLHNVEARLAALGEASGAAFVPVVNYEAEGNFGGVSVSAHPPGGPVSVCALDELDLAACKLLKLDVEGDELRALRGAADLVRRCRPVLFVENDRPQRSPELLEHMLGLDYRLYWHIAPLYTRANFFDNPENVFGNTASVNVLGIPPGMRAEVRGLRAILSPEDPLP